jgi:hypothetical protein
MFIDKFSTGVVEDIMRLIGTLANENILHKIFIK